MNLTTSPVAPRRVPLTTGPLSNALTPATTPFQTSLQSKQSVRRPRMSIQSFLPTASGMLPTVALWTTAATAAKSTSSRCARPPHLPRFHLLVSPRPPLLPLHSKRPTGNASMTASPRLPPQPNPTSIPALRLPTPTSLPICPPKRATRITAGQETLCSK